MTLTPERQAVISHLESVGEAAPLEIAGALGRSPGSTRELLRGMVRDGLLRTPKRGVYSLRADVSPDAPNSQPDAPDSQPDKPDEPDVSPDFPIGKPKPGQIFAWSEADGQMISNDELRRRKGYTW